MYMFQVILRVMYMYIVKWGAQPSTAPYENAFTCGSTGGTSKGVNCVVLGCPARASRDPSAWVDGTASKY